MWVCGHVGMWVCGYVGMWVCGHVGMWARFCKGSVWVFDVVMCIDVEYSVFVLA